MMTERVIKRASPVYTHLSLWPVEAVAIPASSWLRSAPLDEGGMRVDGEVERLDAVEWKEVVSPWSLEETCDILVRQNVAKAAPIDYAAMLINWGVPLNIYCLVVD